MATNSDDDPPSGESIHSCIDNLVRDGQAAETYMAEEPDPKPESIRAWFAVIRQRSNHLKGQFTQFNLVADENEEKLLARVRTQIEEHEKEGQRMQDTHKADVDALKQRHISETKATAEAHKQELEQSTQVQGSLRLDMDALKQRHVSETEAAAEAHKQELEQAGLRMQDSHKVDMDALKQRHISNMEATADNHRLQLEQASLRLHELHKANMDALAESHRIQIQEQANGFAETVRQNGIQKETEKSAISEQFQAQIRALTQNHVRVLNERKVRTEQSLDEAATRLQSREDEFALRLQSREDEFALRLNEFDWTSARHDVIRLAMTEQLEKLEYDVSQLETQLNSCRMRLDTGEKTYASTHEELNSIINSKSDELRLQQEELSTMKESLLALQSQIEKAAAEFDIAFQSAHSKTQKLCTEKQSLIEQLESVNSELSEKDRKLIEVEGSMEQEVSLRDDQLSKLKDGLETRVYELEARIMHTRESLKQGFKSFAEDHDNMSETLRKDARVAERVAKELASVVVDCRDRIEEVKTSYAKQLAEWRDVTLAMEKEHKVENARKAASMMSTLKSTILGELDRANKENAELKAKLEAYRAGQKRPSEVVEQDDSDVDLSSSKRLRSIESIHSSHSERDSTEFENGVETITPTRGPLGENVSPQNPLIHESSSASVPASQNSDEIVQDIDLEADYDVDDKVAKIWSMFIPAWDISPVEEQVLQAQLHSIFSRGKKRSFKQMVEAVDMYIYGYPEKKFPEPSVYCLFSNITNGQHVRIDTTESAGTCAYCKKKGPKVRICCWAEYVPGVEVGCPAARNQNGKLPLGDWVWRAPSSNLTVLFHDQNVRWILRKRKSNNKDSAPIELL